MKILEATSQQTVQDSSETLPQFYCITLIESNRKGKKREKRKNNIFDKANILWKKIQQMTGYKSGWICEKVRNIINLCWFEIDMKSWMIIYKDRLNKVDLWSDKKSCYKLQITNPNQIQTLVCAKSWKWYQSLLLWNR